MFENMFELKLVDIYPLLMWGVLLIGLVLWVRGV